MDAIHHNLAIHLPLVNFHHQTISKKQQLKQLFHYLNKQQTTNMNLQTIKQCNHQAKLIKAILLHKLITIITSSCNNKTNIKQLGLLHLITARNLINNILPIRKNKTTNNSSNNNSSSSCCNRLSKHNNIGSKTIIIFRLRCKQQIRSIWEAKV